MSKKNTNIKDIYELTPMQEGMLFHMIMDNQSSMYFEQMSVTIQGKLNEEHIRVSFNKLIARYDILRTAFIYEKVQKPMQIVLKKQAADLNFVDIREMRSDEHSAYISEYEIKDREKGLELSKGKPIRLAVIRITEDKYKLIWSFHHIIMDGWCIGILIKDFFDIYNSLKNNTPLVLDTVYPYSDYIKWLKQQSKEEAEIYWEEYLNGFEQQSGIPKLINTGSDYIHKEVSFKLSSNTKEAIENISKFNNVTINSIIQTAWGIVLQRYNNTRDVVFGSVVSGRPSEIKGIESMVGLFINTIPVRVKSNKNQTFIQLVKEVQRNSILGDKYSYHPLSQIQSNSEIKQDLIDHIVVFENYPIEDTVGSNRNSTELVIKDISNFSQTNYSLNLIVVPGKEISFKIEFNSSVHDTKVISAMKDHFKNIINSIGMNPEILIKDIEIVDDKEKQIIVKDFNNSNNSSIGNKSICKLFEDQVAKTPDNEALFFKETSVTYRELNAKVNTVALDLRNKGVGPNTIVAIIASPSLEMIIAMLGVLKSGGCYLPIDSKYPKDRINYMLMDSDAEFILSTVKLDNMTFEAQVTYIENIFNIKPTYCNPDLVNKLNDMAYIIYTSGTTGNPKGVIIEHRSIANTIEWRRDEYSFGYDDCILQLFSFSFDGFVTSFFTPIMSGSKVVILDEYDLKDLDVIRRTINERNVTHFITVPMFYNVILQYSERKDLKSLKTVALGGDKSSTQLIKDSMVKNPMLELVNEYGPTENSVASTVFRNMTPDNNTLIGKPIPNVQAYILDKDKNIQPIGVPGELCLGGIGISKGYLKRKELTDEKFISNPFVDGEKIYCSGDLARWKDDGNIEFLGRIDHQVKIRGFRIELGEIENKLLTNPLINEVIVDVRDNNDSKDLYAYIVSDENIVISDLRDWLIKILPEYMIPTHFMQLDEIPVTKNGKVDKEELKQIDGVESTLQITEHVDPTNEEERVLVKIWKDVLKINKVSINDNFFHLGGDSIKAIQVVARLNKFGLKLEMKDLFDNPTIKEVSNKLKSIDRIIDQQIVTGNVELTPIQKWFFNKRFIEKHHFNQAIMLYRDEGFNEHILQKVFKKIIGHHDALRMVFKQNNGNVDQINMGKENKGYELLVYDLINDNNYKDTIKEHTEKLQRSIDLQRGPLVKVGLFKTKHGDHLLIIIHHLVIDGISWRIILEDLSIAYMQGANGEEIHLNDKTDSFKRWSELISQYANSDDLLHEIEYWLGLENQDIKPIPKDNSIIKKGIAEDCSLVKEELSVEQTNDLLQYTNHAYNTEINDILLSALGLSIRDWSGQEKVLVNLEGHGREDIGSKVDISRTVGWFTIQYPIILDVSKISDIKTNIKMVKESIRKIPNKGLGYEVLKYLSEKSKLGNLEFKLEPEISFNYLGQFDREIKTEVFNISNISVGTCVSTNLEMKHEISISGMVVNGKLSLDFTFNKHVYEDTTISNLAHTMKNDLMNIIEHCKMKGYSELTPSDLSNNDVTIDELEYIQRKIHEGNIKDIYTLSPMQEGMLYHSLLDKDSFAYYQQSLIFIEGEINVSSIKNAFNSLIERYDVLRTVFISENVEKPYQVVLKSKQVEVDYIDIINLSEDNQKKYLDGFRLDDRKRGFDLVNELPIRLSVIKLSDNKSCFIWSFHHIIMDGWCLGIVINDFLELYKSVKNNTQPVLDNITPYSNYIKWLNKRDIRDSKIYWNKYLEGYEVPAVVSINNKKKKKGYSNEILSFNIEKKTALGLERIIRSNNNTMSTIIQTAWGLLLQKYNNTKDVVFGAIVSGRPAEIDGIESMVGLFINTIPVRVRCDDNKTALNLLTSIQNEMLISSQYSYSPLAEIQAQTALKGELINHIMVFENFPIGDAIDNDGNDDGIGFTTAEYDSYEQTNYDFNITIVPGESINIIFEYNSHIYNKDTVEQIKTHFINILDTISTNPDIKVKDIDILSSKEKELVLNEFNDTDVEFPKSKNVVQLIEEQVDKHPNRIAVEYEEDKLTYTQLNERSNSLARVLRQSGVGKESVVAIMLERSVDMMVTILAVLKAGGAYLPIDHAYPIDRITYMIEDSGANILLSTKTLKNRVSFKGEIIDTSNQELYTGDKNNLESINDLNDLIYMIYTSGTTGNPKGVMVEHLNLLNMAYAWRRDYRLDNMEVKLLQMASMSFDVFTGDFVRGLISGGTITICPSETRIDPVALQRLIEDKQINIMESTPALIVPMMEYIYENELNIESLKILIMGGDSCLVEDYNRLINRYGESMRIINSYGVTEATIDSSYFESSKVIESSGNASIGKPMQNTKYYILNKNMMPKSIGHNGELYISGDGIARGYKNRPDLTSEKFMNDPFDKGKRMYKTGDLAKWLPDGNIEFIGRIDHQVKIRGYRIELGEIESRLLEHEEIKEAVVMAKEDSDRSKYICAYYVSKDEIETEDIKGYLQSVLPKYMVPSKFVELDKMPLTPNGKIDRKALPEPTGLVMVGESYVAPRNDIEKQLVKVWEDVLKVDRIGINDDFFDLGGHSLKATILSAKVHKALDSELPLKIVFERPTIKGMAEYLNSSSDNTFVEIEPLESRDYYPVSSIQKRIYMLNEIEGNQTTYNMPEIYMIEGDIDKNKLETTLNKLVERHEALRTSFDFIGEDIVQRVHKEIEVRIEYYKLGKEDIEQIAKGFIRPFNLKLAPLFRVGLVELEDNEYMLMIDMHHIISDGVSCEIFVRDFAYLYDGQELKPLRVQYKDYSAWQVGELGSSKMKEQEEYWLDVFKGDIPILQMPTDFERPAIKSNEGSTFNFDIDKEIYSQLKGFARQNESTIFMSLLAALSITLSKYSNMEDVVIGTVTAGRGNVDLQDIMGVFLNNVAFRCMPNKEKRIDEYMMEIRETVLDGFSNQTYPIEEVIERLKLTRDQSRNALFDIMLIYQNYQKHEDAIKTMDWNIKPYQTELNVSDYDMSLYVDEVEESLVVSLQYYTKIFTEETIQRFSKHWINTIKEMTKDSVRTLNDMDLASHEEIANILNETSGMLRIDNNQDTLHGLFEKQVQMTPNNTALVYKDQSISYEELNRKANQLAGLIKDENVESGEVVGIISEKSIEMITSILAVLKAGCTYIPIDPVYPKDRIQYMLKDCHVNMLLAQKDIELPDTYKGKVIDITDEHNYSGNSDNLHYHKSNDLAYVIYTSGTTGNPKGIKTTHKNVVSYVSEFNELFDITDKDITLQQASITFDGFVEETYTVLTKGGLVVIPQQDDVKEATQLKELIDMTGVTLLSCSPLILNEFNNLDPMKSVHTYLSSSDVLKAKYYSNIINYSNVVNMYGPTETTVCATYYRCTGEEKGNVSIGKPLQNYKVYILDHYKKPLPIGIAGEIYISGAGVSQGYLDLKLTKEKFIDNPFVEGMKMYRTGDVGKWLANGDIQYFGRSDSQIKIRGYRIEPLEIESALLKHNAIKEAVVVVRGEEDKQLAAYYTSDRELTIKELREHLKDSLPEYMLPTYMVGIDKIPLNPNGKVDKKSLPEPVGLLNTGIEYVAPSNDIEEILATIWQDILKIEEIGVNHNFFELGGHSLKATIMVGRIQKEFKVDIGLKDVFTYPTIRGLASTIEAKDKVEYKCIMPVEDRDYYPTTSIQKRMFIINQFDKSEIGYNTPMVTQINGLVNFTRLESALQQLVDRHESLRTSFDFNGEEIVQIVHEIKNYQIEYYQSKRENMKEIVEKFIRPFDLSNAPLFRTGVIKISDNEHILMVDMHHIISDGTSVEIIIKEFMDLYDGKKLEPLAIQYRDYAVWLNQENRKEELLAKEDYWINIFKEEVPTLNLPTDYSRPELMKYNGGSYGVRLDKELSDGIYRLTEKYGTTLFTTMLALFSITLSKYCDQEDIIIGTVTAGRSRQEIENLVGVFLNNIALRCRPNKHTSFEEYIKQLKNHVIEGFENQEYPIEELIEKLDITRDMSRNTLFDVMMILQNFEDRTANIDIGSIELQGVDFDTRVSQYDITLLLYESSEGIIMSYEYFTSLFKAETIKRLANHMIKLAEEIISNPTMLIKDLDMITDEERHLLINSYNDTKVEYPRDKTISQLIEDMVEKYPNKIAVEYENESISYLELNKRANQLARSLRDKGVRRDSVVSIMVDRSIDMVVTTLAVMKASGAYLAIDPQYPSDRIQYMLTDSESRILLTQEHLVKELVYDGTIVNIKDTELYKGDDSNLENTTNINDLVYMIYTSGTTGKPKGVMIEHLGLLNMAYAWKKEYKLDEDVRLLQIASMSFDVFPGDFTRVLTNGGTMVICPSDTRLDPLALQKLISKQKITIFEMTPALVVPLMDYAYDNDLDMSSINTLIMGGDSCLIEDFNRLNSRYKDSMRLINNYGVAEATIDSSCFETNEVIIGKGNVSIGKPMQNTRYYILSEDNMPRPVGHKGELFIAGDGIARGYKNQKELTKDKFSIDPFTDGSRMYRTGDIARWLPNGNIDFIGRSDNQIKIRGYRIELGEIESSLMGFEGIREVAVTAIEEEGEKYLCAYVSAYDTKEERALKEYLYNILPEYMIPSRYMQLDKLPLTPNSKIDRKALPKPSRSGFSTNNFVKPINDTQVKLVEIWERLLRVERVGIEDNFFESGGHSLKATMLIGLIKKAFKVEVPLKEIFKTPTIKELSLYIDANIHMGEINDIRDILLMKKGTVAAKNLFLIHDITCEVSGYREFCSDLKVDINCWGIRAGIEDTFSPQNTSIEVIAADYINEIRAVQKHGPYNIGGWSIGGIIAFEICEQLESMGEEVDQLWIIDSEEPTALPLAKYFQNKSQIEFAVSSEIQYANNILPDESLIDDIKTLSTVDELWKEVISYVESNGINDNMLKTFEKDYLDNFNIDIRTMEIAHIVGYMNKVRTLDRALYLYNPKSKVKANTIFVKAKDSKYIKPGRWKRYLLNDMQIVEVTGNHFTIFDNPNVKEIVEAFESRMGISE